MTITLGDYLLIKKSKFSAIFFPLAIAIVFTGVIAGFFCFYEIDFVNCFVLISILSILTVGFIAAVNYSSSELKIYSDQITICSYFSNRICLRKNCVSICLREDLIYFSISGTRESNFDIEFALFDSTKEMHNIYIYIKEKWDLPEIIL